jgi:hypothetical protein
MTMSNAMEGLHSSNPAEILSILNQCIYAADVDLKGVICFHTGVTFQVQTGKRFEILYSFWDHRLLFQPIDYLTLPGIAGLFTWNVRGKYIETYCQNKVIDKVSNDDSAYSELAVSSEDINNLSLMHRFEILDKNENIVNSYHLSKALEYSFYKDAQGFEHLDDDLDIEEDYE